MEYVEWRPIYISVPTSFLIELLNICLKNNIFEFGGKLYKQLIGTAMGIHPASSYANIFMAKLDERWRPPNLRDKLIRARIPDPPRMRPKRLIPGMKPCGLNCPTCPYLAPGTVIYNPLIPARRLEINGTFNCKTRNEVYCITCEQYKLQYIGQTARSLDERVR